MLIYIMIITCECEVCGYFFFAHGGHYDERTHGRLVERVYGCHIVTLVEGLLVPLSRQDLQLPLQVVQLGGLELGDVVTSLLLAHQRKTLRIIGSLSQ